MSAILDAATSAEAIADSYAHSDQHETAAGLRLLASHARESEAQDEKAALALTAVNEELDTLRAYHDATMNEMRRAAVDAGASIDDGRAVAVIATIRHLSAELDAWKRLAIERCSELVAAGRNGYPISRSAKTLEIQAELRDLGIDHATGDRIAAEESR